jgi:hypothetical protein
MDRVTAHSSELHLLAWKHRKEHMKCNKQIKTVVFFYLILL